MDDSPSDASYDGGSDGGMVALDAGAREEASAADASSDGQATCTTGKFAFEGAVVDEGWPTKHEMGGHVTLAPSLGFGGGKSAHVDVGAAASDQAWLGRPVLGACDRIFAAQVYVPVMNTGGRAILELEMDDGRILEARLGNSSISFGYRGQPPAAVTVFQAGSWIALQVDFDSTHEHAEFALGPSSVAIPLGASTKLTALRFGLFAGEARNIDVYFDDVVVGN